MSSEADTPCQPGNCILQDGLFRSDCPIWLGVEEEPTKTFTDDQRTFDRLAKEYLDNTLPRFPVRPPIHGNNVIPKMTAFCSYCITEVGMIERRSLIDLASSSLQQRIQQSAMKGQEQIWIVTFTKFSKPFFGILEDVPRRYQYKFWSLESTILNRPVLRASPSPSPSSGSSQCDDLLNPPNRIKRPINLDPSAGSSRKRLRESPVSVDQKSNSNISSAQPHSSFNERVQEAPFTAHRANTSNYDQQMDPSSLDSKCRQSSQSISSGDEAPLIHQRGKRTECPAQREDTSGCSAIARSSSADLHVSAAPPEDPKEMAAHVNVLPHSTEQPKLAPHSNIPTTSAGQAPVELPPIGQRVQQSEIPSAHANIQVQYMVPPSSSSSAFLSPADSAAPLRATTSTQGTRSPGPVQDSNQNATCFTDPTSHRRSQKASVASLVQNLTAEDREQYERLKERLMEAKQMEIKAQAIQLRARQDAWFRFQMPLPDLENTTFDKATL